MPTKKELIMDWFRVFGWHSSPFEDEILQPVENFIVGHNREREKINYFLIESKRFGTLTAESGNGKTMLLTWLRKELQKYPNRVIADYFVGSNKDFIEDIIWSLLKMKEKMYVKTVMDSPLKKGVSYWRRKTGRLGGVFDLMNIVRKSRYRADEMHYILSFIKKRSQEKHLVVLIDDIGFMSHRNLLFLKMLLYNEFPLQIIAAGTASGIEKSKVKSFKEKDNLHIKLKPLSEDEFRELISRRIQYYGGHDIYPFNESKLGKIYEKGNRNIKRALNLCADAAIKMALRQKQHEKAGNIISEEKTGKSELEAFEESADIGKILKTESKRKKSSKKEEGYEVKVIEREPTPYKIKEVEKRTYDIKEVKKK